MKNRNIQGMYKGLNEFKKDYQSCTSVLKKDYGTIVAVTTRILSSRWEQFYNSLLNIHQSSSFEGSKMYTAEPAIPDVERTMKKLKNS